MIKFLIFLIAAYFVYKIFKSQLMPKSDKTKVKGNKPDTAQSSKIDQKKIEDADFEELE